VSPVLNPPADVEKRLAPPANALLRLREELLTQPTKHGLGTAEFRGPTALYNAFDNPEDKRPAIEALRAAHRTLEATVLAEYGWSDLAGPERWTFDRPWIDGTWRYVPQPGDAPRVSETPRSVEPPTGSRGRRGVDPPAKSCRTGNGAAGGPNTEGRPTRAGRRAGTTAADAQADACPGARAGKEQSARAQAGPGTHPRAGPRAAPQDRKAHAGPGQATRPRTGPPAPPQDRQPGPGPGETATKPAAKPKTPLDAVLAVLRAAEAPLNKAEILDRSHVDDADWAAVRARIDEDPDVVRFGAARGTRYATRTCIADRIVAVLTDAGEAGLRKSEILDALAEQDLVLDDELWTASIRTLLERRPRHEVRPGEGHAVPRNV
jgi:hypothetical protein